MSTTYAKIVQIANHAKVVITTSETTLFMSLIEQQMREAV
jgi:hypothetical protein